MKDIEKQESSLEKVLIVFLGQSYRVPALSTVLQALEGVGYRFIHGVGCRGGLCGACAFVGRVEGQDESKPGLACQSIVEDGLHVMMVSSWPVRRATHTLAGKGAQYQTVREAYPELLRCMGCNTCTRTCPQDLPVMDMMSEAFRNEFRRICQDSFDCILCGMCGARCPADIAPFNIFLYVRRLSGLYLTPPSRNAARRVEELDADKFEPELDHLMKANKDEMENMFKVNQASSGSR
jgi:succinate dehydrogenase/fumarate reductase-like Fe-S protein